MSPDRSSRAAASCVAISRRLILSGLASAASTACRPQKRRRLAAAERFEICLRAMAAPFVAKRVDRQVRSEEHTSELQSLMRLPYAVFCLTKKKNKQQK